MIGFAGLFFEWIYWKHNLELAMLAHMFAHISMNLLMMLYSFLYKNSIKDITFLTNKLCPLIYTEISL